MLLIVIWKALIVLWFKFRTMKKILIAFDGSNFSEGAFEFAKRINEFQPCVLTAVILSDINKALINDNPYHLEGYANYLMREESDNIVNKIQRFKDLCIKNHIVYTTHNDVSADDPMDELRGETRFADLLIIGHEVFYKGLHDELNDNLNDILHSAECPLLLVPEQFDFPTHLVLAYDGTENSVYAINMFANMFPELMEEQALLMYMNERTTELPDWKNIEEYVSQHYKNLTVLKLDADPRSQLEVWLKAVRKPIIIAGAYGRSIFSEFFRKNFLDHIVRNHTCPLFIAHK